MLNQNVEIVLDDGNVVYVDFTITDVDRFTQDVSIDAVYTGENNQLHLEDLEHVLPTIFERVDEYLKSTNQKYSVSYSGVF